MERLLLASGKDNKHIYKQQQEAQMQNFELSFSFFAYFSTIYARHGLMLFIDFYPKYCEFYYIWLDW